MKKILFTLLLTLSGCLYAAPLQVITSFSILNDIAQQIGGEHIQAQSLVGADADAHAYQLKSADLKKITRADLVILNGLGLENADVLRAVKQNKVAHIEATNGINALSNEEDEHKHEDEDEHEHEHEQHEHHHGAFDPHVWQDPVLMQKYAANIAIAFIKADPTNARAYQKRFNDFSNQLVELDTYTRSQLKNITPEKRKVLTSHQAFQYLAHRYHIEFIAPQSVSTESEASAKTVAALIRQIKADNIQAVFAENIKDNRLLERITQETQAKIGGKLYSDALSAGKPANTYLNLFRYNIDTIVTAMK